MINPEMVVVTAPQSKTSRYVIELLELHEICFRGASRNTVIQFDWNDETTWDQTLRAATSVFLVIPPNFALTDFSNRLASFVSVAKRYPLNKIVLLSGRGEVESRKCEHVVIQSGIPFTIVRSSWFNQNFSEGFFLEGVQKGEIVVPVRGTKEPFVDTRDIAEIAFRALTESEHDGQLYEVTGPELLSFSEIASQFSEQLNKRIVATYVPLHQYLDELSRMNASQQDIELTRFLFADLLDGRNEYIADGVKQALGRDARSFSEYLHSTKRSGIWSEATS